MEISIEDFYSILDLTADVAYMRKMLFRDPI
jgi:hypothetical protein